MTSGKFQPLLARTRTVRTSLGLRAFDCVQFVVVRDGSALVFSEFGECFARAGDVLMLGANVLCGAQPEGQVTVTTISVDTDYLLDQLFWQYVALLGDRLQAQGFADTVYTEPAQLLRLGEPTAERLAPWLDELVTLSLDGQYQLRFHRMQVLWHLVIDEISPLIRTSPIRTMPTQRARIRPTSPRERRFAPLRAEARQVRDVLRSEFQRGWSLPELARLVHLSEKQLVRVFTDAYGKTPLTYLTMVRVEAMARLLRETELSVAETARAVGWASRNRATAAFRDCAGITPSRYRMMQQMPAGMRSFRTPPPT
ncbi:MAG: helix-turn-helix transcriptional regulator [Leucobacter sp.]